MRVNWQEVGAVLIMLAWANSPYGYAYPLPFNTANALNFVVSTVLFVTYLYFARSLFRLPFAIRLAIRRYRHARNYYRLGFREALFDGFYRGFLDRRRWETGILAVIDRLVLLVIVLLACMPFIGQFVVNWGGAAGAALMLMVYIYSGHFAFLVGDGAGEPDTPFGNIPNLRRPADDVF